MHRLNNTGSGLRISDNFRSEELIFDIVPFRSGYHALLGRTAFAKFNAVPHYAYLKLKMPGLRGVITVNGNTERSLRTEEHTAALATEAQSSLLRQSTSSAIKDPDTFKRARVIGNRTAWHVSSSHSNAAPTPVPAKRQSPCHAYIITH